MVSPSLEGVVTTKVVWEVPFRPHAAVRLVVQKTLSQVHVTKLNQFNDLVLLPGPRLPWNHFQVADVSSELILGGRVDTVHQRLTKEFASWMHQVETFLQSTATDLDSAAVGRGRHVSLNKVPLTESTAPFEPLTAGPLALWLPLSHWLDTFVKVDKDRRGLKATMFSKLTGALQKAQDQWVHVEGCRNLLCCPFQSSHSHTRQMHTITARAHNIAKVVHNQFLKNKGDQWKDLVRSFTDGTGKKAFQCEKS